MGDAGRRGEINLTAAVACPNEPAYSEFLHSINGEDIMNTRIAALAAVLLLASGCAHNAPVKPPSEPDDSSPVASATSGGASSAGTVQVASGRKAAGTRA